MIEKSQGEIRRTVDRVSLWRWRSRPHSRVHRYGMSRGEPGADQACVCLDVEQRLVAIAIFGVRSPSIWSNKTRPLVSRTPSSWFLNQYTTSCLHAIPIDLPDLNSRTWPSVSLPHTQNWSIGAEARELVDQGGCAANSILWDMAFLSAKMQKTVVDHNYGRGRPLPSSRHRHPAQPQLRTV